MVDLEERNLTGWNLRAIFEEPEPDFMEAEAFFAAFGKYRDINGHKVHCILTAPKHAQPAVYSREDEGVHSINAVLFVRRQDVSGLRQGGSLCIEGTDYLIAGVSCPHREVVRAELEGYSG